MEQFQPQQGEIHFFPNLGKFLEYRPGEVQKYRSTQDTQQFIYTKPREDQAILKVKNHLLLSGISNEKIEKALGENEDEKIMIERQFKANGTLEEAYFKLDDHRVSFKNKRDLVEMEVFAGDTDWNSVVKAIYSNEGHLAVIKTAKQRILDSREDIAEMDLSDLDLTEEELQGLSEPTIRRKHSHITIVRFETSFQILCEDQISTKRTFTAGNDDTYMVSEYDGIMEIIVQREDRKEVILLPLQLDFTAEDIVDPQKFSWAKSQQILNTGFSIIYSE